MIALIAATIALSVLLTLVTLVQILYMESLRLRARELPMLELFRDTIEDRIGIHDDRGALTFSIAKHISLLAMTILVVAAGLIGRPALWPAMLESAGVAFLILLVSTYVAPHVLYRRTSGRWLLPLVPVLRVLMFVVRPLAAILAFFQSLVDLAQPQNTPIEPPSPAEHIEALITAGTEEGILEEEDR